MNIKEFPFDRTSICADDLEGTIPKANGAMAYVDGIPQRVVEHGVTKLLPNCGAILARLPAGALGVLEPIPFGTSDV